MKSTPYNPDIDNQIGCIIGMPNEAYHSHPAVSHSKLWTFHQRPKDYEGKYITKEVEDEPKDCLITGSAAHTILLEPYDDFRAGYACLRKELKWRSKADKIDAVERYLACKGVSLPKEEIEALADKKRDEIEAHFHRMPGRTILRPDQMDLIRRVRDNIRNHPEAKDMLDGGLGEVTFRSRKLKNLGYQVQCRFDWLNVKGCVHSEGRPFGFDVKTVRSLHAWNSEFLKRGYYRAWPFYTTVQKISVGEEIIKDWFWIVAEKEWPYAVMIKRPSPECWERGMAEVEKDMKRLGECVEKGRFPDPGDGGITMQTLPSSMMIDEVPEPGIRIGEEYVPQRDYEYVGGWEPEK
jgi:hypothetical protein